MFVLIFFKLSYLCFILGRIAKFGAYVYEDGTKYIGDWNDRGLKHGLGHVQLKDNTRYEGGFNNGLCTGLGVLQFPDGARYICK